MPATDERGTLQCTRFSLPVSPLLSEESRRVLTEQRVAQQTATPSAPPTGISEEALQQWMKNQFYETDNYKALREMYPIIMEEGVLGGVKVETFIPPEGIDDKNKNRVLINLHGGSFCTGAGTATHLESIPVAALGKIKVVSVDYRMAPEHRFPAATDDVVAVYEALLQDYSPENIGLYGASAGAILSSQTLVRLQQEGIPLPAAVGMIAGGATPPVGDSVAIGDAIYKAAFGPDVDLNAVLDMEYFHGTTVSDPKVTPAASDTLMSAFPPSLLAASTLDSLLSSVVATHSQLNGLGVETELHVWEGLEHVFHYNPRLPESEALQRVIVRFFDQHLGRGGQ